MQVERGLGLFDLLIIKTLRNFRWNIVPYFNDRIIIWYINDAHTLIISAQEMKNSFSLLILIILFIYTLNFIFFSFHYFLVYELSLTREKKGLNLHIPFKSYIFTFISAFSIIFQFVNTIIIVSISIIFFYICYIWSISITIINFFILYNFSVNEPNHSFVITPYPLLYTIYIPFLSLPSKSPFFLC